MDILEKEVVRAVYSNGVVGIWLGEADCTLTSVAGVVGVVGARKSWRGEGLKLELKGLKVASFVVVDCGRARIDCGGA